MTTKSTIAVEQNPDNGTWDVGWKWEDGDFTPHFCGYATRAEAEAEIPGFDERVKRELEAYEEKKEAEERELAARRPNIGNVRARIRKLRDSGKATDWAKSVDASNKLAALLDMDLHDRISWPLPSWKAIESRRV